MILHILKCETIR